MDFNLEELEKVILRIMDITFSSAVDGSGFRDTLFVNYCPHRCEGCHNPQTWDKENGKDVTLKEVYDKLTQSSITNVTFSGGEPFCQAEKLCILAKYLKHYTNKTIWAYSGYTFEQIVANKQMKNLLEMCDVLVDGRFEKDKATLNLRFKGSENQRIIDVPTSLKSGNVVLWKD